MNRAAGRRALARLAREVKRVTLGVGRNASVPEIVAAPPKAGGAYVDAPPAAARFDEHEAVTAGGDNPVAPLPSPDDSQSNLPTVGISKDELDAVAHKAKRDSIDSLLDSFEVSGQKEDKALGRELKAMAGLEPTKTPPPVSGDSDAIESLLAESAPSSMKRETGRESPVSRRSVPPKSDIRPPAPSYGQERQLPTAPSQVKKLPQLSLTNETKQLRKKGGSPIGIILLFVFVIAGFAVALWLVKPGFLTGRTPEKIAAERAAAEAESARIAAQRGIPACHATLVVNGAPKDSEVLIRQGQAPVDVEHMPVGARLEFVATAEGFAPKRAIVPEGAAWDSATGKPRFDLPVQLDASKARAGAVDQWPPGDPGSEVGGKGNPGTVHVISSPKGAEIWLLAGLGPDANIEDIVGCDTDIDVLVAGPTTYRKRLHVPASSFVADPSGKAGVRVAHLSVKSGRLPTMHDQDFAIVKALVPVAWADGEFAQREKDTLEALLEAFGADDVEKEKIRAFAETKKTLDDINLQDLSADDRRILLQHAVLLSYADGKQDDTERAFLDELVKRLKLPTEEAKAIMEAAGARAKKFLNLLG